MSATNSPSACGIANIALNDAMILPHHANPRRMDFSETTPATTVVATAAVGHLPMGHCRLGATTRCPPRGPRLAILQPSHVLVSGFDVSFWPILLQKLFE